MELKFIGDRSGILGTKLLPEENCGPKKMTKMGQKLIKIAQKLLYWTENRVHDSPESVKSDPQNN